MHRFRLRFIAAVVGAGLAALGSLAIAPRPASAASPTTDPQTAARYGAAWIANQIGTKGWLPSPTDATAPDLNTTAYGVLALASTGTGGAAASTALAYLKTHLADYAVVKGADAPAPLATLILAARSAGQDPRTYFGSDLVARLQATRQTTGIFGTADPTYDGTYRQGLALVALGAVGVDDAAATTWLTSQQCDDGGWLAYRADTAAPCPPSDPANFTGEDSNSTAMAVMGLAAQHATASHDAVGWFDTTQGSDGGWAYVAAPDQASDANSTALAIQGLLTSGADVRSARFTTARDPYALLLSFQLGCEAGADAGALAYQPVRGDLTANSLATVQAVPALAGVTLPIAPASLGAAATPVACAAAAPAPTTGGAPASSSSSASRSIATTGANDTLWWLAAVGVLLVLAGTTLYRRNSA